MFSSIVTTQGVRVRKLSRRLRGTDISRAHGSELNTEEPTILMNYGLIQIPRRNSQLRYQFIVELIQWSLK